MIWKILFILAGWGYFIFEGITEGFATQGEQFTQKANQDWYHRMRLCENAGLVIAFHIIFIAFKAYAWIPLFWLTTTSGLSLYEFAFSRVKYGNWLHTKTSLWLGLKHPKGWVWLIVFGISLILLIIVL